MNMGCPAEFICPITQEVMIDPVMVSETGQVRSGSRRTSTQYVFRVKSSHYIHGRCCYIIVFIGSDQTKLWL